MTLFTLVLIVVITLAIMGLGWNTFAIAVLDGFDKALDVSIPILKNLTQEAQAQAQQQQEEEIMIEQGDNILTYENESGSRPALRIEEQEDRSVIVYTRGGNHTIATYDSFDSMIRELSNIIDQMHLWNFTK